MSELYSGMEFELDRRRDKPSELVSVSRSRPSKLLQVLQEFWKVELEFALQEQ